MIEATTPTAHKVKTRKIAVVLHRYIGIVVGLILIVVGLTGSLLVFSTEIEQFMVAQKFGSVTPQEQRVSVDEVLAMAKTAIANRPELKVTGLVPPKDVTSPWQARAFGEPDSFAQVFVNPYTGALMGVLDGKANIMQTILKLHYKLLAGDIGLKIAGIAGLLMFVLGVTGLMLWPGWKIYFRLTY
ncbi:MAG: PepSY domain-containing protein [Pseudanabaena sp. SU_2_4]|nr:PepSY domain-containing protein [Pseudanabaena sp. SU_2_4]